MCENVFRILAVLSLTLPAVPLTSRAQTRLDTHLTFVPADSVVIWGEGESDLRGVALAADPSLAGQTPAALPALPFAKALRQWRREWQPQLTPSGIGNGRAPADPLRCTAMLDAAAALFAQSGHATFMDATERALFNDMLHAVAGSAPGLTFEKRTAARALADGVGRVYATDDEGLWVNLYLNNTAHIVTPAFDCVVDELTAMPFDGRVRVRLSSLPRNGFQMTVRVRIPDWARPATGGGVVPQPMVNGRPVLQLAKRDGYYVIRRAWNNGDEILLELPLTPRVLTPECLPPGTAAIARGPLLFAVADSAGSGAAVSLPPAFEEDTDAAGTPLLRASDAAGPSWTAVPWYSVRGEYAIPLLPTRVKEEKH